MHRLKVVKVAAIAACLAMVLAACGGDGGGETPPAGGGAQGQGVKGGTLRMISNADVDYLDTADAYSTVGFSLEREADRRVGVGRVEVVDVGVADHPQRAALHPLALGATAGGGCLATAVAAAGGEDHGQARGDRGNLDHLESMHVRVPTLSSPPTVGGHVGRAGAARHPTGRGAVVGQWHAPTFRGRR